MNEEEQPTKKEWTAFIAYYIGLYGCLISAALAATVVMPETYVSASLWKYGFAALVLFASILACAFRYGLRSGIMSMKSQDTVAD